MIGIQFEIMTGKKTVCPSKFVKNKKSQDKNPRIQGKNTVAVEKLKYPKN